MSRENGDNRTIAERFADTEGLTRAVQKGVRDALRRHMLLGESVAVTGDNGEGVRILSPEEIRKALDA